VRRVFAAHYLQPVEGHSCRPEANAETSFTFDPPAAKRRRKRNRRLRQDFTVEPVSFSGAMQSVRESASALQKMATKGYKKAAEGFNVMKEKASTAAKKAKKVYAAAKKAAREESDSDKGDGKG